ncbi:DUF7734 family protein [Trichothermofontia sp.]
MMAEVRFDRRLEQYTLKRPQEVLLVRAEVGGEPEEVLIFRGFSSSLTRPTDPDPDIPVLPETARILAIDRLLSPYDPAQPQYLETGLTIAAMTARLREVGV